ncbi:MAG: type I-C CRISPR-associated protein Cas5c [Sphaerospermopsis kisseleviana]
MKLKVWGDLALFCRPEYKSEPHSYPVMTFPAAVGLLESIFWKPEIKYSINSISVLKPIKYLSVMRNMIKSKQSYRNVDKLKTIEEDRTQRTQILLRDVAYHIDFCFELTDESLNPDKYYAILADRIRKGQCFKQPYFGCREYIAYFGLPGEKEYPSVTLRGVKDIGIMPKEVHFIPDKKGDISWRTKEGIAKGKAVVEFANFELQDGVLCCLN